MPGTCAAGKSRHNTPTRALPGAAHVFGVVDAGNGRWEVSGNENLELARWGNGDVHLTFWDSTHGQDVVTVIEPNGEAYYTEYIDSDIPSLTHIPNLGIALLELCDKIKASP